MDKGSRPVRNRKHSRSWTPSHNDLNRPIKRLFTPEIKRMLKEWLVRRRENPYPSREEKKSLALKTGLTYIQICNWFANWRRKLKNAGKEPQKNTWGHLIKNYNHNARGNVEQFSICSNDSIWGDEERVNEFFERKLSEQDAEYSNAVYYDEYDAFTNAPPCDRYDNRKRNFKPYGQETVPLAYGRKQALDSNNIIEVSMATEQCYQVSSTTNGNNNNNNNSKSTGAVIDVKQTDNAEAKQPFNYFSNAKYKNQIMEKYLRGLDDSQHGKEKCGLELSKWLESAANFTPNKNNYIEWESESKRIRLKSEEMSDSYPNESNAMNLHQKEELDAAEALTFLAGNCKSRWVK